MATETLFISNTGEVSCAEHGGGYLNSALRDNPAAKRISTPIEVWDAVPASELIEEGLGCEGCPSTKMARVLHELGYGPDDEHVVVDDLANAAEKVGFKYNLNNDEDCAELARASEIVLNWKAYA